MREHIAEIFRNNPDLRFRGRELLGGRGLRRVRVDGERDEGRAPARVGRVDVFPLRDGLIARKDVYSTSHRPRELTD